MGLFVRWLIMTLSVMAASYLMDGIHVSGFFSAFFAAAILGVLNAVFRPILFLLTLPLTIMTFGLFIFVLNALLLMMVSGVIPGFAVYSFWSAVFGSVLISLISWLLSSLVGRQSSVYYTGAERSRRKTIGASIEMKRRRGRWE